MLDPNDLRAAALLDSKVQERLTSVQRATTPVYQDTPGRPTPCGSAVLLRVGDCRFALTAAHVVDCSHSVPLYIGSSGQPVRFHGTKITTRLKPGQTREEDKLDVAIVCLDSQTTRYIDDNEFIEVQQIDADRKDLDDEILLVAGYPGSRRRDLPSKQTLEVTLYPFLACSRVRSRYAPVQRDPAHHLILGFSKKRLWRQGVRVIAPDLSEMSGCGVWSVYDPAGELLERPRLVGLLTEWHRHGDPWIAATRVEVVLAGIWKNFPELRASLPNLN
jgi:hypothetical protein